MGYRKFRYKGSPVWQIEIREGGQRIRRTLDTTHEEVADARAAKEFEAFKRELLAAEFGLKTKFSRGRLVVEDLVLEFDDELRRLGRTTAHRRTTVQSIARLCETMGVTTLDEITAEGIRAALGTMERLPGHFQTTPTNKPLAARGQNRYRQALSQLFRWLIKGERWDGRNPCDLVDTARIVPGEAKPERRSLSVAELRSLLDTAPRHRAFCYRVAASVGLRRDELDELRLEDVDLEEGVLFVRAPGEKARRGSLLPLPPSTTKSWRSFLEQGLDFHEGRFNGNERQLWLSRLSSGLALPPIPRVNTLRRDLDKAGVVVGNWTLDLHALRVTFGTTMGRAGVELQQAQKLMRHSDPRLTANVYTRFDVNDARQAAEAFEALLEGDDRREKRQA